MPNQTGKVARYIFDIEFAILLRDDDRELLEKVQNAFDCGRISGSRRGAVRYAVNSLGELSGKIVPFFTKHKLYGKKRFDFELWKEAVRVFKRNQ